MTQTKLKTLEVLESNLNISFPVGTAIAVKQYSQKLGFDRIFSRYKKRGTELVSLLEALITYRLTENQSTSRASIWINRPEVLKEFRLSAFEERTLFCGGIKQNWEHMVIVELTDLIKNKLLYVFHNCVHR